MGCRKARPTTRLRPNRDPVIERPDVRLNEGIGVAGSGPPCCRAVTDALARCHRCISRSLNPNTGNSRAIERCRTEVRQLWKKWLGRKSHRARMTWERFQRILKRHPLPKARAIHSIYRLAANP